MIARSPARSCGSWAARREAVAGEIAAALGAEVVAEGGPGAPAGRRSTPPPAAPATSSSACAAPTATAASLPPAAIAAGAWGVVSQAARRGRHFIRYPEEMTTAPGRHRALGSLPSRTRWRRCSPWPGPSAARWAPASSGSPARSARPRSRTSRGRCCRARVHANRENLNTEIGLPLTVLEAPDDTDLAGPGDGDARPRPDRRTGGDRRARGGGDHQRRPGPRRAAGLGGGDRGGQGRGARLPPGDRRRRSPRSRRGSWSRTWSGRRGCCASAPAATSRRPRSGSPRA